MRRYVGILPRLPGGLREAVLTVREAARRFVADGCPDMAAALAFYSLFSLAPLIVVVTRVVGLVLAPSEVESLVVDRVGQVIGAAGAAQADEIVRVFREASSPGGGLLSGLSVLLSLIGATTVLAQLQNALDRVWNVRRQGAMLSNLLFKRLVSVGVLGALALLLVSSVAATALLRFVKGVAQQTLPSVVAGPFLDLGDVAVSWLVFSLLFSLLFRFVPDAHVRWRHALTGGAATGALFVVGKQAIAWYLGQSAVTSLYGAAGSLAAVLTWVFYSALILLFGAELTAVHAERMGHPVRPVPGATWISLPDDPER